ncbi:MAG: sugar O-acetyltransferase [Nitriliruptoraceae bacterium]
MSMMERMLGGELYIAGDPELAAAHARAQGLLERFNATSHEQRALRTELLQQLLGSMGDGVVIKPTLRCDYGFTISIGARTFINYDCVILDVVEVEIGADCQLATRVQLLTATHPIDPVARRAGWESGEPIVIGDNVWLGGGVIVLPGVTVGDDTVVGAGSVVTRSLPSGVVAAGSPARPIREITQSDRVAIPQLGHRRDDHGDD